MREIKFRAWDAVENKMHYPLALEDSDLLKALYGTEVIKGKGNIELMQYTGLKDKNDVEIYGGDIVVIPDYYAKRGVVEYSAPTFNIFDGDDSYTIFDWEEWEYFEVTGNMYENPELLKGGNDL